MEARRVAEFILGLGDEDLELVSDLNFILYNAFLEAEIRERLSMRSLVVERTPSIIINEKSRGIEIAVIDLQQDGQACKKILFIHHSGEIQVISCKPEDGISLSVTEEENIPHDLDALIEALTLFFPNGNYGQALVNLQSGIQMRLTRVDQTIISLQEKVVTTQQAHSSLSGLFQRVVKLIDSPSES